MLRPLLAAALVAALAGCAALPGGGRGPAAAPPAADGVAESTEQDGRFLVFAGPKAQHAPPFLGVAGTNFYLLRSWLDRRTGEVRHQLYVADSYSGARRDWNAARGPDGRPLPFVPISNNEITCDNGCAYAEEFAATLPEALLRAHPGGMAVAFTAKSGAEKTVAISAAQIGKQLAAVDAARAKLPKPVAARW